MTNDENSDLIGGYKSDDSSIEGGDEVTVLVCDKIKRPEIGVDSYYLLPVWNSFCVYK